MPGMPGPRSAGGRAWAANSSTHALIAVLALVLAACTGDVAGTTTTAAPEQEATTTAAPAEATTTAAPAEATTTAAPAEGALSEYGESTDADPALVEKALCPVDEVPDIVLASIARAEQDLEKCTEDRQDEEQSHDSVDVHGGFAALSNQGCWVLCWSSGSFSTVAAMLGISFTL